jgi:peptidoglycan hydrolase FlgJ
MRISQPPIPPPREMPTGNGPEDEALMNVSKQYEGLFVNQLVNAMRKTVDQGGGLIPQSQGERVFQAMLDSEYAQKISDAGTLGLGRMIYEQLLRNK